MIFIAPEILNKTKMPIFEHAVVVNIMQMKPMFFLQHKHERQTFLVVLLTGLVMSAITVIILMLYFVINTFVVKGLCVRNISQRIF